MRDIINIVTESGATVSIPRYWYRGVEDHAIRPSQVGRRQPFETLPDEIRDDVAAVADTEAYLFRNYDFRISRTYSGMSNWGFGVYLASTPRWAKFYGDNIIVATVDPGVILHIHHHDFVQRTEGTAGGRLANLLYAETSSMREQAAIMFRMVKKIKRDAKALYVQTDPDGQGQMCVFNKDYVTTQLVFKWKED